MTPSQDRSNDSWEDLATQSLTFDEQGNQKEPRKPDELGEPHRIDFDKSEAEKILDPENPPEVNRIPGVAYRPLTKAKSNLWEYYMYLCRAASEQHARADLLIQGWDVDMKYSYFKELRQQSLNGQELHTTHLPPNNGSGAGNGESNQTGLNLD